MCTRGCNFHDLNVKGLNCLFLLLLFHQKIQKMLIIDNRHQGKQHWVQCLQIALFWISTRTELGQRRKRVMDTLIVPQVFVAAASCNEWPPLPPLRPPFGSCLKGGFTRGNCSSQGTGGLYDWSITHMRSNYLTIPIYE